MPRHTESVGKRLVGYLPVAFLDQDDLYDLISIQKMLVTKTMLCHTKSTDGHRFPIHTHCLDLLTRLSHPSNVLCPFQKDILFDENV